MTIFYDRKEALLAQLRKQHTALPPHGSEPRNLLTMGHTLKLSAQTLLPLIISTIMAKMVVTLRLIQHRKILPLYPITMLNPVLLTGLYHARFPTIYWWWGVGTYMMNGDYLPYFKHVFSPNCDLNCNHWDNYNNMCQVCQLFFRIITAHLILPKKCWKLSIVVML